MGQCVERVMLEQGLTPHHIFDATPKAPKSMTLKDWNGHPSDAIIDFSLPDGLVALCEHCAKHNIALITGTTGADESRREALHTLSKTVPVVAAANFSKGMTLLFHLAAVAARGLADYDAEVLEMHHRNKVDAPGGSALRLAEAVADTRGYQNGITAAREGHVGARPTDEVGVMSLRGGDVVGEHTLILAGPGERMELTHRATDRHIFARGAVSATLWALKQGKGLYNMRDVLNLA